MKIGIIGSGHVGLTLGEKFLKLGNEVMISSRDVNAKKHSPGGILPSPRNWVIEQEALGYKAYAGNFANAAEFGEVVFNCSKGNKSLEALFSAGKDNLKGKILVDIANPLDFSIGMPPSLTISNTNSLGEEIQANFPETKVVKTLNTVNAGLMVEPSLLKGEHDIILCGNDSDAKEWVKNTLLIKWLGWKNIIDLGDITSARAMEMYLSLWVRLYGLFGTSVFNIHIEK